MGCGGSKDASIPPRTTARAEHESPLYVPPDDFPSAALLAHCQREFAALDTTDLQMTDDDGLPLPFPPKENKAEFFSSQDYVQILKNFTATDDNLALLTAPLEQVVKYLNQLAADDVGRLYVLFAWVVWASHSLYDLDLSDLHNLPERDTVAAKLILAKQNYGYYNDILYDLCRLSRWTVKKVDGIVKVVVVEEAVVVQLRYSWLAVLLDGYWRLIDVDFAVRVGARVKADDLRIPLTSPRIHKSLYHKLHSQLLADFYFLTDPEQFIFSHFPDEQMWQMLAKPVSLTEFTEMTNVTESFFLSQFENVLDPQNTLRFEGTPITLEFAIQPNNYVRLSFELQRMKGAVGHELVNGISLKDFCTLENDQEGAKTLEVGLPEVGLYVLTVRSVDVRQELPAPQVLGRWFFRCEHPDFTEDINPPNPRDEYGIGAEMNAVGVEIRELDLVHGFAHLRFESNDKFIEALHTLESRVCRRSKLQNCFRYYVMNNLTGIIMKFPTSGKYILKMFLKERGSTREYQNICNYLLCNKIACPDPTMFPVMDGNRIGFLIENEKPKLTPLSHPVPFLKVEEAEPITMEFKSKIPIDLQIVMKVQTLHSQVDISDYVWWNREDEETNGKYLYKLQVRLPKAGIYCLDIRIKLSEEQDSLFTKHFRYVFLVNAVMSPCFPFPKRYPGWDPRYSINGVSEGLLVECSTVRFAFTIPHATDVVVYRQDAQKYSTLHHEIGYRMGNDVELGKADQTLDVGVKFTNKKAPTYILQYKVITQQEMNAIQSNNQSEARERSETLRARLAEETNHKTIREEQEEAKLRMAESKFQSVHQDMAAEVLRDVENFEAYQEEISHKMEVKHIGSLSLHEEQEMIRIGVQNIIDEQDRELSKLRRLYKEMTKSMYTQRLQEARQVRHQSALRRCIEEWKLRTTTDVDRRNLKIAERQLDIMNTRNALVSATRERDVDEMIRLIDEVKAKGFGKTLYYEVSEAQKLVDAIQNSERLKFYVLNVDKKTMSELHAYHKPPESVHRIMQAVLLLLGEDEETTAEWSTCARMSLPQGAQGLNRRVASFDITKVHPEIRERAKQLLSGLDFKSLQRTSSGSATFYIWAMGTIEEYETATLHSEEVVQPANVLRQKEIFSQQYVPPTVDFGEM